MAVAGGLNGILLSFVINVSHPSAAAVDSLRVNSRTVYMSIMLQLLFSYHTFLSVKMKNMLIFSFYRQNTPRIIPMI